MYGVLLGTQKGRSIEICNSFELVVSDERQLDREYFTSKEEQCKVSIGSSHPQIVQITICAIIP